MARDVGINVYLLRERHAPPKYNQKVSTILWMLWPFFAIAHAVLATPVGMHSLELMYDGAVKALGSSSC